MILYLGPMWAGKTTALINEVRSLRQSGQITVVLKPRIDNRYDARRIVSHTGRTVSATLVRDEDHLAEALNFAAGFADAIALDEVQFFPPTLADMVRPLADGIRIVAAGLDRDCFGEWFPSTRALLDVLPNEVAWLTAKCEGCGQAAQRTRRFDGDGKAVTSGDVVQVGGSEAYGPVCIECFEKEADHVVMF